MSINSLKDLNSLPASESKNDDSSRGCFTKPCNGNMNENVDKKQRKKSSPIHVNGCETVNSGVQVANSEVEYFESENLSDLEDIDTNLKGVEGIKTYGIDRLIQAAASQLSESREAAQTLLECQTVYKKSYCLLSAAVHKHPELDSWEHFCHSKLSPLSAQAVLRVTNTNVAREGLVFSS